MTLQIGDSVTAIDLDAALAAHDISKTSYEQLKKAEFITIVGITHFDKLTVALVKTDNNKFRVQLNAKYFKKR